MSELAPIRSRWTKDVLQTLPTPSDVPMQLDKYGIDTTQRKFGQQTFYPLLLLQHIFTEQVLTTEMNDLKTSENIDRSALVSQVLGSDCSASKTYIQVFAILKLMSRLQLLPQFISEHISDQELPIDYTPRDPNWDRHYQTSTGRILGTALPRNDLYMFKRNQSSMLVHFFDGRTGIYNINEHYTLPYYEISSSEASGEIDTLYGGYGRVSKIQIHPLCHAFHDVLETLKDPDEEMYFAMKEFHKYDPPSFEREVDMLQRFHSTRHPHLVTLLAAFSYKEMNYLIFPWATHDLQMYWQKVRPNPEASDAKLVQWVCYQAWMLVEAVRCIHVPGEETNKPGEDPQFGRHGDLKADNILWYKSSEGFGKLVITDFGTAKTHTYTSKTYTIQNKASAAPRYRPPELEYAGGRMGRTFDIWTLGCLFFEFLTWLHGGYAGLKKMEANMMAPSIRGTQSDEYFEWVYVNDRKHYSIRVKEAVVEGINNLRKDCSQFVYDFLDIIENHMLVVERDARISAHELEIKMKDLHQECGSEEYCTQKVTREPRATREPNLQERKFHKDLNTKGKDGVPKVRESDSLSHTVANVCDIL